MNLSLSEEEIRSRLARTADQAEKQVLLSDHFDDANRAQNHLPKNRINEPLRPAAILVPMLKVEDIWHLLFIRRAEVALDLHSGQVAFPGGGSENNEKAVETALRETYEEIGLLPKDVNIVGELDPLQTISGYIITPIVGIIPYPYPFKPAVSEVSAIFTIPLAWLADPQNYEEREVVLEISHHGSIQRQPLRVIYYLPYQGNTLWGASARITHQLLSRLGEK